MQSTLTARRLAASIQLQRTGQAVSEEEATRKAGRLERKPEPEALGFGAFSLGRRRRMARAAIQERRLQNETLNAKNIGLKRQLKAGPATTVREWFGAAAGIASGRGRGRSAADIRRATNPRALAMRNWMEKASALSSEPTVVDVEGAPPPTNIVDRDDLVALTPEYADRLDHMPYLAGHILNEAADNGRATSRMRDLDPTDAFVLEVYELIDNGRTGSDPQAQMSGWEAYQARAKGQQLKATTDFNRRMELNNQFNRLAASPRGPALWGSRALRPSLLSMLFNPFRARPRAYTPPAPQPAMRRRPRPSFPAPGFG